MRGDAVSVTVLATGGTIASGRWGGPSVTVAPAGVEAIRSQLGPTSTFREVMSVDSAAMSLAQMAQVRDAVEGALSDSSVTGIVVLHGTDSLEETAMLLDLFHDDDRPVVCTGAQRPADHHQPDGPGNLAFAIEVASRQHVRGRGVLVAFGGRVLNARGVRKVHTTRLAGFDCSVPRRGSVRRILPWPADLADVRVDVVALYPGMDRVVIDACRGAGARGLVLEALGSGNGNPTVVDAVRDCTKAGVEVVVTSRVPLGIVEPVYGGGGGGYDLLSAGAVFSPWLRAGQARVLLTASIATNASHDRITATFRNPMALGEHAGTTLVQRI